MNKIKIEVEKKSLLNFNTRDTVHVNLHDIDISAKDSAFCEVTEWTNGDGYDVHICTTGSDQSFSITDTDFKAIKLCIKALNKR